MNKILSGLLLAGALGMSAQADIVRVEAGAGVWQNEITGGVETYNGSVLDGAYDTSILGYDKETKPYFWVYVKHPVPVLPNLRLEYAAVDYSGNADVSFDYKGTTYTANSKSDLTLNQYDLIMYYNILDNTFWTTIDLGLDVKIIEGDFQAVDSGNPAISVSDSETIPVPMAYVRGRVEIPGTDVGIEGNVKYIGYGDSKVMDYALKLDYTLVDILPVDVGLEVGYRFQQIDLDGDDFSIDTTTNLEVDGVFAGAVVRF